MQSMKDYLLTEIGKNPQKVHEIDLIVKNIQRGTNFTNIMRVRGDGSCLIRAILCRLKEIPNILMSITINLCMISNTDIFTPDNWMDFENKFCILVRNLIIQKWNEKGEYYYHMSDNAIDGLAIIMAMKLLNIDILNVYQAFNGADRIKGWRQYLTSQSFHSTIDIKRLEIHIFTLNGTHYNGLV